MYLKTEDSLMENVVGISLSKFFSSNSRGLETWQISHKSV
jgi:hypothetical protein